MPRRGHDALKVSWIKCPRCGRQNYGYRAKEGNFVCRVCGATFQVDWIRARIRDLTIKEVE